MINLKYMWWRWKESHPFALKNLFFCVCVFGSEAYIYKVNFFLSHAQFILIIFVSVQYVCGWLFVSDIFLFSFLGYSILGQKE